MSIRACYMLLTSALLLSISTLTVSQPRFKITEITDQLDSPWSLAELPDGQLLITERRGRLIRINADQVHRITGVPDVLDVGQGGLLDIKLHPALQKTAGFISVMHRVHVVVTAYA